MSHETNDENEEEVNDMIEQQEDAESKENEISGNRLKDAGNTPQKENDEDDDCFMNDINLSMFE